MVKCHGGKFFACRWIIQHFPPAYTESVYVEPFAGGASVFFNKLPSKFDILNDVDPGVAYILHTIRDYPREFIRRLLDVSYSQKTFDIALNNIKYYPILDSFEIAINEYILRRMSRGGMRKAFAFSERLRGGIPGDINSWNNSINNIMALSKRLQNVSIENRDALECIAVYNADDVVLYCDPPYLSSVRTAKNVYQYEFSEEKHIQLLEQLKLFKGKVLLSGYFSELYYNTLCSNDDNWFYYCKDLPNHACQSKKKSRRIEWLWVNY